MKVLTKQEAREAVEKLSKEAGFFTSDMPIFAKERHDICALIRHEESGADSIYLVWKNFFGEIKCMKRGTYQSQRVLLTIKEVIKTHCNVVINVYNDNRLFGSFLIPLSELDLEDSFD